MEHCQYIFLLIIFLPSSIGNHMVTKKPQVLLTLNEKLLNRIEDFRYNNRVPTRSEAMRQLLEAGLDKLEEKKKSKK